MSRLIVILATTLLTVTACKGKTPAPARATATPVKSGVTYYCDDGRTVLAAYGPDQTAALAIRGKSYNLRVAQSGSGARYVGDELQWWTKGQDRGRLSVLTSGEDFAADPGVNCSTMDAPVEPPEPGMPGGLPDDRTPVSEAPFTPTSAQGAADVVQRYFAFIESGRKDQAWSLWSDAGRASGADTPQAFAATFDRYKSYHAQVGAPGLTDGAAGSIFIEVPVVIYGRLYSGPEVHQSGKVTLRRVNGVDGATPEQLLWRIARIELEP